VRDGRGRRTGPRRHRPQPPADHARPAGQPLTAASHAAPEAVVNSYLLSRGRAADVIASLRTTQTVAGAGGVTHLRIAQEIDGLAVRGAYARAAINSRGELVQMIDRLAAVSMPAPAASTRCRRSSRR